MAVTLKSLETKVEKLALLEVEKRNVEITLAGINAEIQDLRESIIKGMTDAGTSQIRTAVGSATVTRSVVPRVVDWSAFDAYVIKHKAPELFQRRIMVSAWRERTEAGETIPGVETAEIDKLTFRMAKA